MNGIQRTTRAQSADTPTVSRWQQQQQVSMTWLTSLQTSWSSDCLRVESVACNPVKFGLQVAVCTSNSGGTFLLFRFMCRGIRNCFTWIITAWVLMRCFLRPFCHSRMLPVHCFITVWTICALSPSYSAWCLVCKLLFVYWTRCYHVFLFCHLYLVEFVCFARSNCPFEEVMLLSMILVSLWSFPCRNVIHLVYNCVDHLRLEPLFSAISWRFVCKLLFVYCYHSSSTSHVAKDLVIVFSHMFQIHLLVQMW